MFCLIAYPKRELYTPLLFREGQGGALLWVGLLGLQCLDGEAVAVESEAADDAAAGTGDERVVAELLAGVNIRDVHLDDGRGDGADAGERVIA